MSSPANPRCHAIRDSYPNTEYADAGSGPGTPPPGPAAATLECHVLRDTHPDAGSAPTGGAPAVLELRVRNHPGAMSHITGLFARRSFNLEAIVCVPVGDGSASTILLLVADEPRLEQVERQLAKLYDVLSVRHRPELGPAFFAGLVA